MRKNVKRLRFEDRKQIETMIAAGIKMVDVAEAIGVHRTTIYKELKRGGIPYQAEIAQKNLK